MGSRRTWRPYQHKKCTRYTCILVVDGVPGDLRHAIHLLRIRRGGAVLAGEEGDQRREGLLFKPLLQCSLVQEPFLPKLVRHACKHAPSSWDGTM